MAEIWCVHAPIGDTPLWPLFSFGDYWKLSYSKKSDKSEKKVKTSKFEVSYWDNGKRYKHERGHNLVSPIGAYTQNFNAASITSSSKNVPL